ncbi:MAG: tRNA-dihydrouridine synthase [Patescibacteria group bacterium]|jgi:nifR3 family TIM-barrel protein
MSNTNFWPTLTKPILALAPMEDVTDAAFRQIIAKYGKPDVMFTEFASVDGIVSNKGRDRVLFDLQYDNSERPIVAQLFGSKPENFYLAAKIVSGLDFDGIDINMGCPDKSVVKQGAGSALIKDSTLAKEVIAATKEGAGEKPVSVKTRIGFSKIDIEEWIPALLEAQPAAITVHGRTRKEMSKVPANWDIIGQVATMARGSDIVILGNGDVRSTEEAIKKVQTYKIDGAMIGRGIFGNPWFFNKEIKKGDLPLAEVLAVLFEHTKLFEQLLGNSRPFMLMRKHFASYLKGYDGAKELKMALMETSNAAEVGQTIEQFLKTPTQWL